MTIIYKAFIFLLALPIILHPQSQDIKFERISIENGLPHSKVNCITQDQKGFMWFGTGSGLCRYDGFKLKVYKNSKNDQKNLFTNKINCIYVDRSGTLWIGAKELHRYNQQSDDFTRLSHNENWGPFINDIKEDRFGTFWLSTGGNRLVRFDRKNQKFSSVLFSMKKDTVGRKFTINSILISRNDVLWVATSRGLYKHELPLHFSMKKNIGQVDTVMFIECYRDRINGRPFQWTDNLYEDSKNNIWFSSEYNSLTKYNVHKKYFKHYPGNHKNKFSIRSKAIRFIDKNVNGHIIIGTANGCNIFDQKMEKYIGRDIIDSNLKSYYRDCHGVNWFGTQYEGIIKINK